VWRRAGGHVIARAVRAIPVVGDLVTQAEGHAQWLQELVEHNARLAGQLPETMKHRGTRRCGGAIASAGHAAASIRAGEDIGLPIAT